MKNIKIALLICIVMLFATANGEVTIDGEKFEVIDIHLHVGEFGVMPIDGKKFVSSVIGTGTLYLPAIIDHVSTPYGENLGIKGNMEMSGFDRGLLLGVYTHTIGYATNSYLEELLIDEKNDNGKGEKLFYGLASVNFDGYDEPGVSDIRLEALESYFAQRPDLFVGLKFAHAHSGIPFDSVLEQNVYEVAAKYSKPVLLHTGFSPFPGSKDTVEYYDPIYMEEAVARYDGLKDDGTPDETEKRVNFVFAHSGSGDKQAIKHVFELLKKYPNTYIDLSAIKGAFKKDINGAIIPEEERESEEGYDKEFGQVLYILNLVKQEGFVDRAIYSSDGPQYPGMLAKDLDLMIRGLQKTGYTKDEIRKILAGNGKKVFFPGEK